MCKAMTTKSGSRRWSFSVFCNLLDIAGINAWIIYQKKTGTTITKRNFHVRLSEQLTEEKRQVTGSLCLPPVPETGSLENRLECRVDCRVNRRVDCRVHQEQNNEYLQQMPIASVWPMPSKSVL